MWNKILKVIISVEKGKQDSVGALKLIQKIVRKKIIVLFK